MYFCSPPSQHIFIPKLEGSDITGVERYHVLAKRLGSRRMGGVTISAVHLSLFSRIHLHPSTRATALVPVSRGSMFPGADRAGRAGQDDGILVSIPASISRSYSGVINRLVFREPLVMLWDDYGCCYEIDTQDVSANHEDWVVPRTLKEDPPTLTYHFLFFLV
jgi:hypothetical protein